MINAVLVSHTPHLAGAERMLLNLALLLQRTSLIEPVLLIPGEGAFAREAVARGLRYEIIPPLPWYIVPSDQASYQHRVRLMTDLLRQSFIEWSADIIIANTLTSVPAVLAAVELNLPSVVWVHGIGDSFLMRGEGTAWTPFHDRFLLQCASRIVACSNWTRDYFVKLLQQEHVDVIPNWTHVDPAFVVPHQKFGSRRFICLNTFAELKGHAVLLEAAALLHRRGIAFDLDLVGADNKFRIAMRERAAAMGLDECVHFCDWTSSIEGLYDKAICLVTASYVESFGMTLIEAMARKTPVIAARSGGPNEIVDDGITGYLVDRGDAKSLADRMERLIQSQDLARQMGEHGYLRARNHFSEEAASPIFVPFLQEVVDSFAGYEQHVQTMVDLYQLFTNDSPPVTIPTALRSSTVNTSCCWSQCDSEPSEMIGRQLWNGPEIGSRGVRYPLYCERRNLSGLQWCVSATGISPRDKLRLSIIAESSGVVVRRINVDLRDSEGLEWVHVQFPPILNSAGCNFTVLATAEIAEGRCVFFEPWPQDMPLYRQMAARVQKKLGRWPGIPLSRCFSPFFPLYGPKR